MKKAGFLACTAVLLGVASSCSLGVVEGPAVTVGQGKGPPPHAPAHGYRPNHTYLYYPSSFVYFDVQRAVYFYAEDGNWTVAATLPGHIHIDVGEGVTLSLDTETPYAQFERHKAKYPPGRSK